jgi:hypothetical protein
MPQRYPGLALLLHDSSHMKILSLDPFPAREISVTPQLLPLFMFHEVELGATTNEVAIALGGGMEWVRERAEATRLCFRTPGSDSRRSGAFRSDGWGRFDLFLSRTVVSD